MKKILLHIYTLRQRISNWQWILYLLPRCVLPLYHCHDFYRTSRSFLHSRLLTGFVTRLTRRVPLVEQELLTLPEHLSSPQIYSGVRVTRSLVLYVCFVDSCLSFCTFSFDHCVVCSSSIYVFWLPLWYLLAIVLFVLLPYTDYDCHFGIFWPLCCLFFFDIRILITPLVSSNTSYGVYGALKHTNAEIDITFV